VGSKSPSDRGRKKNSSAGGVLEEKRTSPSKEDLRGGASGLGGDSRVALLLSELEVRRERGVNRTGKRINTLTTGRELHRRKNMVGRGVGLGGIASSDRHPLGQGNPKEKERKHNSRNETLHIRGNGKSGTTRGKGETKDSDLGGRTEKAAMRL